MERCSSYLLSSKIFLLQYGDRDNSLQAKLYFIDKNYEKQEKEASNFVLSWKKNDWAIHENLSQS